MSVFTDLRRKYHQKVFSQIIAFRQPTARQRGKRKYARDGGYLNFADGDNEASVALAASVVEIVGLPLAKKPPGEQSAGNVFTNLTREYIEQCFRRLSHIRPGEWEFTTRQPAELIAEYDQYAHLKDIAELSKERPELAAVFGRSYFVRPDIVIGRSPIEDTTLNKKEPLIGSGDRVSLYSPLRQANAYPCGAAQPKRADGSLILHASISCKWTLRSDRAQNARTEALNLIRTRKGNTPHIVVVTMEPLPSRLASIALGTGDIDCTYHAALNELLDAAAQCPYPDSLQFLKEMVEGRRLRDISDLPLDLAV